MGNIASSGPKAWPVRVLIPGTTRRTFSRLSTVPSYDQLAIEIVGRGDAGQRLHGAQRIIERHAAELSQLRASKRLLRGHTALARPEQIAADDQPEPAVRVRRGHNVGRGQLHKDAAERLHGSRIDHEARDRAGRRLCVRVRRARDQQHGDERGAVSQPGGAHFSTLSPYRRPSLRQDSSIDPFRVARI